tara:strand:+ start:7672 stop:7869 length:198 start_codon:yes stop_codon:yes gene_type:complete
MLAVVSWRILNMLTPEVNVRFMSPGNNDSADMTDMKKILRKNQLDRHRESSMSLAMPFCCLDVGL